MAGAENNLSGKVGDYQSRVDQSVRVSRDEQSSPVEWQVFGTLHNDLFEKQPQQNT
jgi:hypothetical protein